MEPIIINAESKNIAECCNISNERFEVIASEVAKQCEIVCRNPDGFTPAQLLASVKDIATNPTEVLIVGYLIGAICEKERAENANPILKLFKALAEHSQHDESADNVEQPPVVTSQVGQA